MTDTRSEQFTLRLGDDMRPENAMPLSGERTSQGVLVGLALGVALAMTPAYAATAPVNPQPGNASVTYMNYQLPAPPGHVAGQVSVGSNWRTDTLMFGSALRSVRIGFADCSAPAVGTWDEPSSDLRTSEAPHDPIRFTDSQTGRTFVVYLAGKRELVAFTDNDGLSWTRGEVGASPSGVIRRTVGGGVFHDPMTRDPNGTPYPNAVYSCSQTNAIASCARSDDGGVTFGPAVAIRASADCSGIQGTLRVAPDGTVYVPGKSCGDGQQSLVVSEDNGATWAVRKIPGSAGAELIADTSVGVASDGTIYFGYVDRDGHPKFSVSQDKGVSWSRIGDLGLALGIQNAAFPVVIAGDPDRAALVFMGSPAGDNGASYVFVAHTYDGGLTWTAVNATPADPVQRASICREGPGPGSCRDVSGFLDATIDRFGRVVVGHADSRTVLAGVARQVNGQRMFAEYDRIDVPAATLAVGTVDPKIKSVAHLSWSAPDDHGSAITGYRIERREASGSFAFVADLSNQLNYDDTIDPAGRYVYRITAINAVGEGPSCDEMLLEVGDANGFAIAAGPAPVVLGSASTFAVLAASTATNTGATTVNGDLGVSPGTTVTGAPTVTGTLHLGDPLAAQAQLDLTTAYNDAAGRTVNAVLLAGNLGGQTLAPGLYKSTSSLEISSGDLTLDAQGDPNAVFIFQMASTLVTTSGRQVILSGGAQAANIFWQVGSSATIGTNSVFKGNILALASITLTTGSTVEGRVLARTGAIAMDSNVVGLGSSPDTTRPTVSSTVPVNAAPAFAINQKITATFSEAMNPLTISTATFTLKRGTTAIGGTVSYTGVTATLTSAGYLAPLTAYTATITTGAKDLAGNALLSSFVWSFTTGAALDTGRPTVSFTVPANASTGVVINHTVAATFSEAMDPVTISTATFTLKQGATPVAGTVTYGGVTATFAPTANLTPLTIYTATITTGAKDLAGNALASSFVWSFTTGAGTDTTRPTVSSTVPTASSTAVPTNRILSAAFSEAMDPLTINTATFRLKRGTTAIGGTVNYSGVTATFTSAGYLAPLTVYTATITTGSKDLAGNALLSDFVWTFTTAAGADTSGPTVKSTVPGNAATGVAMNQAITAVFSKPMDPLTINTATFTLKHGVTPVAGTVGYAGVTASFLPTANLTPLTVYTATITTGAKDLAGNALLSNVVWSFTTAGVSAGPAPVALGSASTFAVLAASTVTSTGATTVNGDLGVSPGTTVTGAPTVTGTLHLGDPLAAQAQLDLTTAYNDAAGRTVNAVLLAGNLGGQTLAPGLYKSTSSLEISSGDLTLDAQGDPNAVFIFQMASTLVTTSGRQVILSGGAQAANIFWQVGSSATIGTNSVFKGNILALASITATTGASVEGRLLARTASVSLDSNIVGLGNSADATAPTVSSTVPANAAPAVAISQKITATFSEAMDPLTINTATFSLKRGTTAIGGAVTYTGVTATFTSAGHLAPLTAYTATITTGAKDLASNALLSNYVWTFTTGAAPDTGRPTVSFTVPANAATGVAINHTITASFSEAMDPGTISNATFTLTQGATPIAGTVTYTGVTATFTPSSNLTPLTVYTATITTGAKDLAGNALLSNFVWSFTTSASSDTTRPIVTSAVPTGGSTAVATNRVLSVAFSEAMDPLTINTATFSLKRGTTAIGGTVSYSGATATFTSAGYLAPSTLYTATITTGAKDLAGNALLSNFVWTFTTAAGADTVRPTSTSTVPANAATGVAVNQSITAAFGEAMDALTLNTSTFTLKQGATPVAGTVGYTGLTATFTPTASLAPSTGYTATITTGAKDVAGNALLSNLVWSFTTAGVSVGPAPVALGSASTFAVLGASTVTNTGVTTVNGDLGVSPGTTVTGAPVVTGTLYLGDPIAAQAQLDLTIAYNDAAGRTVNAVLLAGNLGGLTLAPGLYTSASSLEISSGDLTLDAQGDPNAVFIFQMGSTLVTTAGRQVILSGGAQAANIFWQVGSSATIGTTSVFKGNILALASITVTTGATVEGRLLARTGAVAMDSNGVGF